MSNSETKICQNCQKEFIIEPNDFLFYEKINVPSPTFCPECRMIRRMCFRNERSLYKRKCGATEKEIISIYSPDKPFKIYDQKYWNSDNWDPMEYGKNYDFLKPFFEQFRGLMNIIPHPNLMNRNDIDSSYCNWAINIKNCYLSFRLHDVENCMYALGTPYTKDSVDVELTRNSELCYETIDCANCYKLFFSKNCEDCINSFFLFNCKNCSDCFCCVNLRNQQYQIFNKKSSKDEYFKKLNKLDIRNFKNIILAKKQINDLKLKYPHRFAEIIKSINSLGDNLKNVKDCFYCFDSAKEIENCKYMLYAVDGAKDCYDGMFFGLNSELTYEAVSCQSNNSLSVVFVLGTNHHIFYSFNCHNSHNLFGCIGLRHKEYCILNKQYTKEEYEKLVPKIIEHMNSMPYISNYGSSTPIVYKYGEFFPPELSPFCYNETIAQEYFPLTKEQAIEKGYQWKDPEERNIKIDIKTEDLPDNIKDVSDDIVNKIIQCANTIKDLRQSASSDLRCLSAFSNCTTAFKIIKPELEFYKKMNLPLPRLCPNCRHYQRIKQRNPLKLWHRKCQCNGTHSLNGIYKNTIEHFHGNQPCPNEFETTYAPDRKEIVYCESCYLQEVV